MSAVAPFRIERLADHDRKGFSSGEPSVDRWFRESAGQMASRGLATTHVMVATVSGEITGYYSLSNFTVTATELPLELGRKLPQRVPIPAHLIGQLGVDARYQGQGYGRALVYDAVRRAERQTTQSASFGVVVHALTPALASWYIQLGFRPFEAHPLHLIISMKDIRHLR